MDMQENVTKVRRGILLRRNRGNQVTERKILNEDVIEGASHSCLIHLTPSNQCNWMTSDKNDIR